jgi:uncharacterized RDD family membrane protein YckC
MIRQTYRRTDIELGAAQGGKRPLSSESRERLMDSAGKTELTRLPLSIASVLTYFLMLVLAEGWLMRGASPGKLLMGIRVSPVKDEDMDLNRAALRNLVKVASVATAFAGVLMAFWSKRRQMLHDVVSGSYVHDAK